MDYYLIGQKIRKYRKAQGISQEQLAERIGVSVTHMSHIETGNTKLSLPVFVAIADSLNVRTDDLLSDGQSGADPSRKEIEELLKGCTIQQMRGYCKGGENSISEIYERIKLPLQIFCRGSFY